MSRWPSNPAISRQPCQREEGHRLALTASGRIPDNVTVALDWGGRGRLRLCLPFPATRAGFVVPDGRQLPTESRVAVGALAGVRAEAVVPCEAGFEIQAQYSGRDAVEVLHHHRMITREIPALGGGHHSLDLAYFQPAIEERLELGDDPDASVKLHLHSNQVSDSLPHRRLFVKRFDLQLEGRARDPALLGLDEQSRRQADPGDVEELELEALSLLEPDEDAVPLERWGSDVWRVPEDVMEQGPYLVLGRQGGWYRVRPMRWYVIDRAQGLTTRIRRPSTVAELYAGGFASDADQAPFISVVRCLARDPDHWDWPVVFSYIQQTALPIQTFDLIRMIARTPTAAAMAAVVASTADFALLWERMNKLPFAWWQVPLSAWERAFEAYVTHRKAQLAAELSSEVVDRWLRG